MDRREARRIAVHRAGLIIESALNEGWEPDDLIEREGQEAFEMINEELTKIAESMINGGRVPRLPVAKIPEPPRASVLESTLKQMIEGLNNPMLSRLCFHPGGAPAVWKHPADSAATGYWERRCPRCGAWAQNRYTVPFLGPALMEEPSRSTTGSNGEKAVGE